MDPGLLWELPEDSLGSPFPALSASDIQRMHNIFVLKALHCLPSYKKTFDSRDWEQSVVVAAL